MTNSETGWHIAYIKPRPYMSEHGLGLMGMHWRTPVEWCIENFGPTPESGWCYVSNGLFEFREETDHLLFLLKWA